MFNHRARGGKRRQRSNFKAHPWDPPKNDNGEANGPTKVITVRMSEEAIELVHQAAKLQDNKSMNLFCLEAIKASVDKTLEEHSVGKDTTQS